MSASSYPACGPAVRKTPSWPRSWLGTFHRCVPTHGNAWANSHILGQPNAFLASGRGVVAAGWRRARVRQSRAVGRSGGERGERGGRSGRGGTVRSMLIHLCGSACTQAHRRIWHSRAFSFRHVPCDAPGAAAGVC
jgi:hypothetical protein